MASMVVRCPTRAGALTQRAAARALAPRAAASSVARPAALRMISCSADEGRFRLNNLSPFPGSTKKKTRKGRGYGAGQGGSCGFGMRGQRSRSGRGTRPGHEGGAIPLYLKVPKLKGICGGMPKSLNDYVVINIEDLNQFEANAVVDLDALKQKRIINPSGRDSRLPLKILGDGELTVPLTINAGKFTASAQEKIEAAGGVCNIEDVNLRTKWTKEYSKVLQEKKAAMIAETGKIQGKWRIVKKERKKAALAA